jgi:hypothetical protein
MIGSILTTDHNIGLLEKQKTPVAWSGSFLQKNCQQAALPQEVIANLIDGVLILGVNHRFGHSGRTASLLSKV